jgi:hypothetical protein
VLRGRKVAPWQDDHLALVYGITRRSSTIRSHLSINWEWRVRHQVDNPRVEEQLGLDPDVALGLIVASMATTVLTTFAGMGATAAGD